MQGIDDYRLLQLNNRAILTLPSDSFYDWRVGKIRDPIMFLEEFNNCVTHSLRISIDSGAAKFKR